MSAYRYSEALLIGGEHDGKRVECLTDTEIVRMGYVDDYHRRELKIWPSESVIVVYSQPASMPTEEILKRLVKRYTRG